MHRLARGPVPDRLALTMPDRLGSKVDYERRSASSAGQTRTSAPYALPRRGASRTSSRSEFLRAVPMLAGLSETMRHTIASRSTWVSLPAGEWLFRKGDEGDSMYVVNTGRLEVVIDEPGPEVVRVLTAGSVVGELALLTREARSASVRARRDTELLKVTSTDFAELLSHELRFSLALLRELGRQLRVSRGLAPAEDPLPATIAVTALDPAAGRAVWTQLGDALAGVGPVALLEEDPDRPERAYPPLLDRAERDAARVLMLTGNPALPDPWTAFCLRQADRILIVADARQPPRSGFEMSDCDVVVPAPVRAPVVREWMAATGARAFHPLTGGAPDRGVQRLARRLAGLSTGVVLSSGGARGFAHIGVLEELLAAGIEIDRVGGSSMGAFVGAMLAMGMTPAEIAARCREEMIVRRPLGDYALPVTSLVRGGRALAMLARTFGERAEIEELSREFFCVSSDLLTGEQVVHRAGPVTDAVAASMCLPGIFPPISRNGALLVDGGVLDSLPVLPMAATMEGPIVAVDVGRRFSHQRARGRRALPTIKETLARSMVLGSIESAKAARQRADVVIEPDTGACEMLDFRRLDEMIDAGRQAAREALAADAKVGALSEC